MPEAALPSLPGLADAPTPAAAHTSAAATSSAAAERAERARRNGACSRGPVTDAGKATASRNALRHGLCAKVHLVLAGEDDDAFTALAADVLAEVAPLGTVDGFLATRLAAAMWQTGRADRLEAQAFAAGELPDPDRLRLALRYRGSIGRDLFRALRELRPHLQAAATARAEVASSPTSSLATPPPTPTAGTDDSGPPTLALHTGGDPRDGSGVAGSRPQEDAAAEPGSGTSVDQVFPDPSPDDPTIVLRHGLTLADLLAPDGDVCTSEPELALQPAVHPIDARERATPCSDTACTDEPERLTLAEPPTARPGTVDRPVTVVLGAWCRDAACTAEPEPSPAGVPDPAGTGHPGALRAGKARPNEPGAPAASTPEPDPRGHESADPVGIAGPRHRDRAPRRNEPSAPACDTPEPDGVTSSAVPVGSVADPAGPPVDAWSRMWGLTPPAAPSRPALRPGHEPRGGHAVVAHPSAGVPRHHDTDTPAATPAMARSGHVGPAPRAPDHLQPAAASADMHCPPRAAEPAGITPSPPAAAGRPRHEAHQPGAHPGSAGRRRRAVSRRHRTPSAWPSGDHRRSNDDPGAPLPEAEPLGPASPAVCSGSRPLGSVS